MSDINNKQSRKPIINITHAQETAPFVETSQTQASDPIANAANAQGNAPMLTKEQLCKELDYRVAMSIARTLRRENVISDTELHKIERKIADQFSAVWAGIA